jgi:hypothetical protein
MSARSTIETCRPELPSNRRNMTGQKTFQRREGKIHTDTHQEERHQKRAQAKKGDPRTKMKCREHDLKD